jgi:hypothetical protein
MRSVVLKVRGGQGRVTGTQEKNMRRLRWGREGGGGGGGRPGPSEVETFYPVL